MGLGRYFKKLSGFDPLTRMAVGGSAKGLINPEVNFPAGLEPVAPGEVEAEAADAQRKGALAAEFAASEAQRLQTIEEGKKQFRLREDLLGQQAAAGGATRSGNEADYLGTSFAPRRRGLSRTLLG